RALALPRAPRGRRAAAGLAALRLPGGDHRSGRGAADSAVRLVPRDGHSLCLSGGRQPRLAGVRRTLTGPPAGRAAAGWGDGHRVLVGGRGLELDPAPGAAGGHPGGGGGASRATGGTRGGTAARLRGGVGG